MCSNLQASNNKKVAIVLTQGWDVLIYFVGIKLAGLPAPLVVFDVIVLSIFQNYIFYNSGHLNFGGKFIQSDFLNESKSSNTIDALTLPVRDARLTRTKTNSF